MPRLNNFLYKHSIREKIGVGYNNYTKRLLQVKKKKKKKRKRKRKKKNSREKESGRMGGGGNGNLPSAPSLHLYFFLQIGG